MKRKFYCFLFAALFVSTALITVSGQKTKDLTIIRETNKVALVIGNSNYQNGFNKLSSPQNDATAVAAALKRLGFRLVGGKAQIDATFAEMETFLDQFTEELKNGGVGFFYFSGHGSQNFKRENYLIPVDTKISYQSDLAYKAMQVEHITSRMEETGNILNILVLDACRNNPLPSGTKSGGKGLNTNNEIPSGIYVAFAARDGQTALDGDSSGYSLYTRELLKNIETPNERLEDIFIQTRIAVKNETKNLQFPIDYGSVDGKFYFRSSGSNVITQISPEMLSNRSKQSDEFFNQGLKCASDDYDCQITNYSKSINLEPFPATYNNRGYAYYNKLNFDRAIHDYNTAIGLDPNVDLFYLNRAAIYDAQERYTLAIQDYTKAIELNPKNDAAYNNRGYAYFVKADEMGKAIQDFNTAIELNPKNNAAYLNRGNYFRSNNYEAAMKDYNRAIELNPNFGLAFRDRANSKFSKQLFASSILDYSKAIELGVEDIEVFNSRGVAYTNEKDYERAIKDFTKMIEMDSSYSNAYNNRGIVYKLKKLYSRAIDDFTKAIDLNPKEMLYYQNRADVYELIGESSKAVADRKIATGLDKP